MADKIVVMNEGLIEQIGSPLELYALPDNMFVAEFIGAPQMNLLPGTAQVNNEGTVINLSVGANLSIDNTNLVDGQNVYLGVRPEHFSLQSTGLLDAVIELVEPMGNETHLSCSIGSEELRLVGDASLSLKPGQSISLGFEATHAHVFDAESGRRLPPTQAFQ